MSIKKTEYTGELVKIFLDRYDALEPKLNNWLQENPEIEITQRLMSTSSQSFPMIAIFYRQKASSGPYRS